jgi:hypothetical protein
MEKPRIRLKTEDSRLCERISLCLEPELKELWDFCNDGAEGVPEAVRTYLRGLLPGLRDKIIAERLKTEKQAG